MVFLVLTLRVLWKSKKGQKKRKQEDDTDVFDLAK